MIDKQEMFGANLRSQRRRRGLSQEDLAERSNISRVFISNMECGKQVPSLSTLKKLSEALAVDVSELIGLYCINNDGY